MDQLEMKKLAARAALKYVKGFLKCISDKDTSKFYCPIVSSVEWS